MRFRQLGTTDLSLSIVGFGAWAAGGDNCGAWLNPNFGSAVAPVRINQEILHGWGVRPYDWQFGASVQHELFPRTSIEVGYHRRWFGNFTVTDNQAVGRMGAGAMTDAWPQADKDRMIANIPLGRFGTPEEIADLALFLASPRAAFIKGARIDINGGAHMD